MRHSQRHQDHARRPQRSAFTLVELLVVIAIIGTLVGLLLPAVQAAREAARSNTCRNNMTQLQKALTQRETTLGGFPGYTNNLGVKGTTRQVRASWVVTTFPYIEQRALHDLWSQGVVSISNGQLGIQSRAQIEILICPSDPPLSADQPLLSYVGNAGWIERTNARINGSSLIGNLPNPRPFQKTPEQENPANGIFFDASRNRVNPAGDLGLSMGPADYNDMNDIPVTSMTAAYIQKGDGLSQTLMLSENMRAVHWAYLSEGGYNPSNSVTPFSDEKYHFGFCWQQPDAIVTGLQNGSALQYERLNSYDRIAGATWENYQDVSEMQPSDGFPTSEHPGGVNVAFVGGSVQFVSDQMEPRVYAQLMTSNGKSSDLYIGTTYEKNLPPLSQGEF